MPITDTFVSVIAPLHNAAAFIESYVVEVTDILRKSYSNYELVLVDDGSTDETARRVDALLKRHQCIRLIRLSRHFGTEIAISAGLESVIGDFVVVMLPESDPTALIPELVSRARASGATLFGVAHDRSGQPLHLRMLTRIFYSLATRVFHLPLTPDATYFRVLSRQAVNAITAIKDRFRYLRLTTAMVGFAVEPFEYAPAYRAGGRSDRGLFESLDTALGLVTSATVHPLRLVSWLALCASGMNLLYAVYVLAVLFLKSHVQEGWVTLSLQSAGMFFLICLILAMLCEYTGRILEETRARPLYHVLEERNSSVMIADATRRNVVTDSAAPPVASAESVQ